MTKIWQCKIGEVGGTTAPSDILMRSAVAQAYLNVTGQHHKFIFSGWGAELNEAERAVVEDRLPDPAKDPDVTGLIRDLANELAASYLAYIEEGGLRGSSIGEPLCNEDDALARACDYLGKPVPTVPAWTDTLVEL